jgi:hypothetical protein
VPDAEIADDDLERLTQAYLTRRSAGRSPHDLEDGVMKFVLSHHRRTGRALGALGAVAVVVISLASAVVVIALHVGSRTGVAGLGTPRAVQIVRKSGALALPPLARTVSDVALSGRIATDLQSLPAQPSPWHCPNDFGTVYTLTFVAPGSDWTAVIDAQGCQTVEIESGPKLTAARSPRLWEDLGTALGLTAPEAQPTLCPGTPPGTIIEGRLCVAQA